MGEAVPALTSPEARRIVTRVRLFAEQERLFRRVTKVIVAVSGGPDSVAALLVLRELSPALGFEVAAAHFDHLLRPGSAADRDWVRALCERLEVPCFTGEGDVASVARDRRSGIEETARAMRYQFLAFIAARERADLVATGHTAADQAETVAQRVIRGSGVRGLRGMLPSGPVPGAPAQRLGRPLLVLRRSDTGKLCELAGIEPRCDPTNESPRFQRNRIRSELLPLLRSLNPSVDEALLGLAESAREAFGAIERPALALVPSERGGDGSVFRLAEFRGLQAESRVLVIEREGAFQGLAFDINRTRVKNLESIVRAKAGAVRFGQVEVEVSAGLVRVGRPASPPAAFAAATLNVPGVTLAGPWRISVATSPLTATSECSLIAVPRSGVAGALRARPLVPGDRLLLRGSARRVADVLSNEKVPAWVRRRLVAIADSRQVLALPGAPDRLNPYSEPGDDVLYVRVELSGARSAVSREGAADGARPG